MKPLILGAVAYDPKVVTIWEGFKQHFVAQGLPFDFVLYSNYERLVEDQLSGVIDVAWNSPLAYIEADRAARARGREARAIAMRDTDRDLTSIVVVRADAKARTLQDLAGAIVAVGAADSPQATLIPLTLLADAGLQPGRDFVILRNDVLVGKHGDHIGGEREAARQVLAGRVDAACMIDGNHLAFTHEGTLPPGSTRVLAQTPPYDHCNFTVLDGISDGAVDRFVSLLFSMSYDDATVRPLLDMEGLKTWLPGRATGYSQLNRAVDLFGSLDAWLARVARR